jgi:hypothetical protein
VGFEPVSSFPEAVAMAIAPRRQGNKKILHHFTASPTMHCFEREPIMKAVKTAVGKLLC